MPIWWQYRSFSSWALYISTFIYMRVVARPYCCTTSHLMAHTILNANEIICKQITFNWYITIKRKAQKETFSSCFFFFFVFVCNVCIVTKYRLKILLLFYGRIDCYIFVCNFSVLYLSTMLLNALFYNTYLPK